MHDEFNVDILNTLYILEVRLQKKYIKRSFKELFCISFITTMKNY